MALSATQEITTKAPSADVNLRFYGGLAWTDLTLTDYELGELPTGWTDADTPAAGWVEISERVWWDGNLVSERDGSASSSVMSLKGQDYDSTYLGTDQAIVALIKIEVTGTVYYDWQLWFLGMVVDGEGKDDYKHGGEWSRELHGLDTLLKTAHAPRTTAGPINLAPDGSADATSTLATPAEEAGSGEFVGTVVNVDPENVLDSNINTLWISQNAPAIIGEDRDHLGFIEKVFFSPVVGYSGFWWFELVGPMNLNGGFCNEAGVWLLFNGTSPGNLGYGDRAIVTSDRAIFDAYTGGAPDAKFIVEAKSWKARGVLTSGSVPFGAFDGSAFNLDPEEGYLRYFGGWYWNADETVAWNQDGSDPGLYGWYGGAVDVSALPVGSAIRRKPEDDPSGYDADNWMFEAHPQPGMAFEDDQVEALMIDLGAQAATLTEAATAGDTELYLSDTRGFPAPPSGETYSGVCEGDDFTYSGRSTSGLTGVSGLSSNHALSAAVYPLVLGVTMTGWPCSEIGIVRRSGVKADGSALPVLDTFRVYIQKTGEPTPAMPGEEDWELDWDTHYHARQGNTDYVVTFPMMGTNNQGFRWVRRLLVYVQKMSDDGRAKVNEVWVKLAQTEVNGSGEGDLDTATSAALAQYLLESGYGLADGVFVDRTAATTSGVLGSHATAIAPYTQVLEDLARVTGCVVRYSRSGHVVWLLDPWWPTGAGTLDLETTARLGSEHVRGEVHWQHKRPNVVGVVVRARSADGMYQWTAVFPPGADTEGPTREFKDYVVASEYDARLLAETLYVKESINYLYTSGPQEASLTIKGVGEWCGVDQWVELVMSDSDCKMHASNSINYPGSGWITERVTWQWRRDEKRRTWACKLDLRKFMR